jgi:thiol-disulfide isomerase/thioredoxin
MNKWKLIVIVALCTSLLGYGAYRVARRAFRETPSSRIAKLVGAPAPAWNIPANLWINTPRPIDLKDLHGHVTLIEFFRVECPHCQVTAPIIKDLLRKYGARGLKVVAFHSPGKSPTENNWQDVQAKLRQWKIAYPVAFDEKATLFKKSYNGASFPTILVLDRSGIVRFAQIGMSDEKSAAIQKYLDNAFSQSA